MAVLQLPRPKPRGRQMPSVPSFPVFRSKTGFRSAEAGSGGWQVSARDLFEFFDRPSPLVARALVGCAFSIDGVGGTLVETEAYTRDDEASHSFRGPRSSNAAMFGPPATAYVYRIYGLHLCLNFVCRDAGAVLVRALVPEMGLQRMAERRGLANPRLLCSGPGRLGQALGIHLAMNLSLIHI